MLLGGGGEGWNPADFRTKRPQSGRVLNLFSDFCRWEFDVCCFPPLSPGSFPYLAPSLEQGGRRYHMSITVFALVVPYVALLILSACSSNLPTEIWKKRPSKCLV